jgi:large subunit ribosomal protein L16
MALTPKKTKFRKQQRMRLRGKATGGNTVEFGEFGLQSLDCYHITVNQIEAARKALTHHLKRGGKVWVRAFADKIKTARAAETRMGGGKGAPDAFVAPIRRGHMLFEIAGVPMTLAKEALRLASHKLPVETRFVVKK